MPDTSRAPDRIWAFLPDIFDNVGVWQDEPSSAGDTTPYIREDISLAREAAAYEAAAQQLTPLLSSALAAKDAAYTESYHTAMAERADGLELGIRRIRALTPADAKAALDRLIAEAVVVVIEKAVDAANDADSLELATHGQTLIVDRIRALTPTETDALDRLIAEAVKKEREENAQIATNFAVKANIRVKRAQDLAAMALNEEAEAVSRGIADAIRSRGKKDE